MSSRSIIKEYLGYSNSGDVNYSVIDKLLKLGVLNKLDFNDTVLDFENVPTIEIDELKKQAIEFYKKYFSIHDILYLSKGDLNKNGKNLSLSKDEFEAYKKYYALCRSMSAFDLPIEIISCHSMEGGIEKSLAMIGDFKKINNRFVPFSSIYLGKVTLLSVATYIHEIAHSQTESNIGYAENYLNKEVISIFLEKVAALELDSTGELLKKQERCRFAYMYDALCSLFKCRTSRHIIDEDDLIEAYVAIHSTLLAEKLFDNYLNEKKQKKRDAYMYDIQDIFDGKITVEDSLGKREINMNKAMNSELIKRHIKK